MQYKRNLINGIVGTFLLIVVSVFISMATTKLRPNEAKTVLIRQQETTVSGMRYLIIYTQAGGSLADQQAGGVSVVNLTLDKAKLDYYRHKLN